MTKGRAVSDTWTRFLQEEIGPPPHIPFFSKSLLKSLWTFYGTIPSLIGSMKELQEVQNLGSTKYKRGRSPLLPLRGEKKLRGTYTPGTGEPDWAAPHSVTMVVMVSGFFAACQSDRIA